MLAYKKISNIDQHLFDCCDKIPGNNTPGGDCCYDAWVTDLIQVTADWKQANADAINKETEYNLAVDWRDKLKAWCDDWEATDEKAEALCRQLELFVLHLEKVCQIIEKTNQAIEILFCMIEDLYIRVDGLKTEYDTLLQCINCLKRPEFGPTTCIMTCIADYGIKLDAVIKTRDVLIPQVITALELAYGLHIDICDEYGLKKVILYWKQKFNCDGTGSAPSGPPTKIGQSNDDCCCIEPRVTFPIDKDKYVVDLGTSCTNVKQQVDGLKKDLDAAKEKRDALLACKQALEKAISEVNPANKCN